MHKKYFTYAFLIFCFPSCLSANYHIKYFDTESCSFVYGLLYNVGSDWFLHDHKQQNILVLGYALLELSPTDKGVQMYLEGQKLPMHAFLSNEIQSGT